MHPLCFAGAGALLVTGGAVWRARRRHRLALAAAQAALAQERKERAAREAMQALLSARNEKLRAECDALREQIERLHNRRVTDAEYEEFRKRLHAIRNS